MRRANSVTSSWKQGTTDCRVRPSLLALSALARRERRSITHSSLCGWIPSIPLSRAEKKVLPTFPVPIFKGGRGGGPDAADIAGRRARSVRKFKFKFFQQKLGVALPAAPSAAPGRETGHGFQIHNPAVGRRAQKPIRANLRRSDRTPFALARRGRAARSPCTFIND